LGDKLVARRVVSIHSCGGAVFSRYGLRESDERSFLSQRIINTANRIFRQQARRPALLRIYQGMNIQFALNDLR
jgi:hypothetical protein